MKALRIIFFQMIILAFSSVAFTAPRTGFFLPDSVNEMTINYRSVKGLIVLPVMINDSIVVNLILDTGCRNIVLFGKKFQKLIKHFPEQRVQFSGLGNGKPVHGFLSLSNKVSINEVLGENIPVVIVPNKNLFSQYVNVHGVIGYDIFLKFEIELNPAKQTITFRPAQHATIPAGFHAVPLRIVDSRPIMDSEVLLKPEKNKSRNYELMIDTGSSLGLLLKTTNIDDFPEGDQKILGLGFNGPIYGYKTVSDKVHIRDFILDNLPTGVIQSPWHNYASVGMEVLKDYIIVLNYCKAYAGFKSINA